jgi:thiamine transport system ATP-binding protein
MLTLDGLRIKVGGFALRADFSVQKGERVAVIGPSGAGKSTLLGTIAGFITPVAGRVIWDSVDMTDQEPGTRPLSVIFQDNNLFPHMTAFDNVALGIRPSGKLNTGENSLVRDAFERVGLTGFEDRKPGALSGGQQSRVALARVLVRKRPLVLLDEPFSALGPALKDEMLDLVATLVTESGATLLMVTHDPNDAARIAGQTVLVADGVAHAPQDTASLLADPPEVLKDYLG